MFMLIKLAAPGGLQNLLMAELGDVAPPGPGEIQVRIHASSLNYHDYLVVSRPNWAADGRIPLSDASCVVEAVGAGVTEFNPGDHVVSCYFPEWQDGPDLPPESYSSMRTPGDGVDGYARTRGNFPATWFTRSPVGWSHEEAATITTAGVTAWRALVVDGNLKAGDWVLVLGTGGVSIWALQIAKAMGARVIATSSSDKKLERLTALGADHVINYSKTPEWGAAVLDITGGRGVDYILEVGGPRTIENSLVAARVGGHVAFIGFLGGPGAEVPMRHVLLRQLRLQGLLVGSRRHQADFVHALDATGIRPVLDRAFPLAELRQAFEWQEAGKHFGKIPISI
jgi:NADPH:quinone reductase-like Zn-dependent oxidoreductase